MLRHLFSWLGFNIEAKNNLSLCFYSCCLENGLLIVSLSFYACLQHKVTRLSHSPKHVHKIPCADVPPRDRSQSPKLIISKRPGDTSVKESSQVLDEKVSHKTVEVLDEVTGKPTIQRLQVVQKVVETEVMLQWPYAF